MICNDSVEVLKKKKKEMNDYVRIQKISQKDQRF